ncbi:Coenzyme A disulfide reductase [Pirellulimonas nuda]|uniref:Coenzyme A disulfide reductase n=1 Tax=Pirellulimonas nuda TaxID=2528009 RepID=A0A518DJC0_9BACT|nr:FAD-dependent oxidoreductase [Pirellulimonas nuda]QDU91570.1 Coenzyme A disulfide reductase [Pirellulimonas nuda]
MKIFIVGGVAGGASAAARARRLDESAEIVLLERGPDPSFANCGMPYYIGGEIESRAKLLVSPIQRLIDRYRLDVRTLHSVESINRAEKTVAIRELATGAVATESYDKLILSPGAAPVRPPTPGADLPGVYTLRNLDDADRLQGATARAKRAVVIGGGFIGVEMIENLTRRGLDVTLIERDVQVLPPWDAEMIVPIAAELVKRGVRVLLGTTVERFEQAGDGLRLTLDSGESIAADFVVMSIGVRPENTLAVAAGLEVGPRGGILVNPHMQTTDPDIYAVGDAVQTFDSVTGAPAQVPLAGPANRQGRIAADHIFGRDSAYRGTQGTAVVGLWDHTAAMTGLSEKACQRQQREYQKVYLHPAHHAGYYPGAEPMTLKLLFDPETGHVLGAQAVGGAGVDKRIDVIAMAIQAGMTVYDLEESELCYAPQYGSAKDPVNMAGFIAAGVLRGDQPIVHSADLLAGACDGATVVDVRTPTEFALGAVPGAVNLPLDELRGRLGELPEGRPVIAYCQVGMRGYMATRLLNQSGRDARNLSGGFTTYARVAATK